MSRPEAAIQRKIARHLTWALPDNAWFTAIAHGVRLDDNAGVAWLRAVMSKDMGAQSGVPDMLIIYRGRAYWGEVKSPVGSLTDAQKATGAALGRAQCPVALWRSLDDALASCREWGIPLRTSKPTTEAIRRGFAETYRHPPAAGYDGENWPASESLIRVARRRRKATPQDPLGDGSFRVPDERKAT